MPKTIEVTIDRSGNSEVTVNGACGSECEGLVSPIQKALGRTTNVDRTPDFNRRSTAQAATQKATRQ